jgi:hypothetical protein
MRTRGWVRAVFLLFTLGDLETGAVFGQSHGKAPQQGREPWRWTLEERVEARFGTVAISERQERHRVLGLGEPWMTPAQETISGSLDPELLFPVELWETFARRTAREVDPAATAPAERYRRAAAALGLGAEVMDALFDAVAPLIEFQLRWDEAVLRSTQEELESGEEWCVLSAQTRAAAAEAVGTEALMKFLYGVVAPELHIGGSNREDLIRRERGCQG